MGSSLNEGIHRRDLLLDWLPLMLYLAASAAAFKAWGPPLRNDWAWAWVLGGLLMASLRQLRRWLRGIVVDWLPFVAALIAYDAVRGWSDSAFSITPHVWPQIDVDKFLFFGHIPSVVLQHAFYERAHLHWWDYGDWGIYITHFIVTVIVAAILWRLRPKRFREFRAMVVLLSLIGVVTYAVYPAAPPWMASAHHYIPHVERVPLHAAGDLGIQKVGALFERGVEASNLVAPAPSLHAAFPHADAALLLVERALGAAAPRQLHGADGAGAGLRRRALHLGRPGRLGLCRRSRMARAPRDPAPARLAPGPRRRCGPGSGVSSLRLPPRRPPRLRTRVGCELAIGQPRRGRLPPNGRALPAPGNGRRPRPPGGHPGWAQPWNPSPLRRSHTPPPHRPPPTSPAVARVRRRLGPYQGRLSRQRRPRPDLSAPRRVPLAAAPRPQNHRGRGGEQRGQPSYVVPSDPAQ